MLSTQNRNLTVLDSRLSAIKTEVANGMSGIELRTHRTAQLIVINLDVTPGDNQLCSFSAVFIFFSSTFFLSLIKWDFVFC